MSLEELKAQLEQEYQVATDQQAKYRRIVQAVDRQIDKLRNIHSRARRKHWDFEREAKGAKETVDALERDQVELAVQDWYRVFNYTGRKSDYDDLIYIISKEKDSKGMLWVYTYYYFDLRYSRHSVGITLTKHALARLGGPFDQFIEHIGQLGVLVDFNFDARRLLGCTKKIENASPTAASNRLRPSTYRHMVKRKKTLRPRKKRQYERWLDS